MKTIILINVRYIALNMRIAGLSYLTLTDRRTMKQ